MESPTKINFGRGRIVVLLRNVFAGTGGTTTAGSAASLLITRLRARAATGDEAGRVSSAHTVRLSSRASRALFGRNEIFVKIKLNQIKRTSSSVL